MTTGRPDEAKAGRTPNILVVDDAPEFLALIVPLLRSEGYETEVAADGLGAVRTARRSQPDVIVLDLTLPDLDGVEACRQIRAFSDAYIIMLTSRTAEIDRVVGLEVGADDYMTKPFSPRELIARIRAMLRRPRSVTGDEATAPEPTRTHGALRIDVQGRTVTVDDEEVHLTRIEFDLLDTLSFSPTTVFTRAILRDRVWGPDWFGDDHVVDVHIANLRKKIDSTGRPSFVRTVRGVGYRMEVVAD